MAFSTHHRHSLLITGALTIVLASGCQSISGWLNPWSAAQVEKTATVEQESQLALAEQSQAPPASQAVNDPWPSPATFQPAMTAAGAYPTMAQAFGTSGADGPQLGGAAPSAPTGAPGYGAGIGAPAAIYPQAAPMSPYAAQGPAWAGPGPVPSGNPSAPLPGFATSAPVAYEPLPGTSINDVPGAGSYRERSSAPSSTSSRPAKSGSC